MLAPLFASLLLGAPPAQGDEARASRLAAYADAARTAAAQRFAPCSIAYVRAEGLAPGAPYALYWFSKASPVLGSDAPARRGALSSAASNDLYRFPASAGGAWTLVLADLSGGDPGVARDSLDVAVERGGTFASLSAGPPRQPMGGRLSVSATVRNLNASAQLSGMNLRYAVEDPAQASVMDPSGVFRAAPGTTRLLNGLSVPPGGTAADSFTVSDPRWPAAGRYLVYAEWQFSCSPAPPIASAVATFDVVPPSPNVVAPAPGSTVAAARPTFSGTGLAGASVTVEVGGQTLGPVTVETDWSWSVAAAADLSDGTYTATATQAQNGVASEASAPLAFSVDVTPPEAPALTSPASGLVTGGESLEVRGKSGDPTAARAELYDRSTLVATAEVAGGAFEFTVPGARLGEGGHLFTARALDGARNRSAPSGPVEVIVDRTPPEAPVLSSPASALVAAAGLAIQGTGGPDAAKVELYDGTALVATAEVAGGRFGFTVPGAKLAEGEHRFTAMALDEAGNRSAASNPVAVAVDRTPPRTPALVSPEGALVTSAPSLGISAASGDPSAVRAELYDGSTLVAAVDVSGESFGFVVSGANLGEGYHFFAARTLDAAGNRSAFSNEVEIAVDRTAPMPPALSLLASPTRADPVLVSGTAEPESAVEVMLDGSRAATALAAADGRFEIALRSLDEGSHEVTASATDLAGNAGPASAALYFAVDRTAPRAPRLTWPASGLVTGEASLPIAGAAGEDDGAAAAELYDGPTPVAVAEVVDGGFDFTLGGTKLEEGIHPFTVRALDAAGNRSPSSNRVAVTVVRTPPGAPVASASGLVAAAPEIAGAGGDGASDDGRGDGSLVATAVLARAGPASSALVADGARPRRTTATDGHVSFFSPPITLVAGSGADAGFAWLGAGIGGRAHPVPAAAVEAGGDGSAATPAPPVPVDHAVPRSPVLEPVARPTRADVVVVSGSAESGATVQVIVDGEVAATVTAGGTGAFAAEVGVLAEGSRVVSAVAVDTAGNAGPAAIPVSLTVDRTPPAAPALLAPEKGALLNSERTLVLGRSDPGAAVSLTLDGAAVEVLVGPDGAFSASFAVRDGDHSLSATAADAAGNLSPAVTTTFSVDATAPVAPVVASPHPGQVVPSEDVLVAGTAEAGALVAVAADRGAPIHYPAGADGSFGVTVQLAEGAHELSVTAADAAGNVSPAAELSFTVHLSGGAGAGDPVGSASRAGCGCGEGAGGMVFAVAGLLVWLRRRR